MSSNYEGHVKKTTSNKLQYAYTTNTHNFHVNFYQPILSLFDGGQNSY